MDKNFIHVINLTKSFYTQNKKIEVLKNINLQIAKGDIYGIIGFSGAGKSTLVRCINRLETPDSGQILIGGKDITMLSKSELNEERKKIGMIFQTFNLFDSKTVFQNIEYPLKSSHKNKSERKKSVLELIELVGLTEKTYDYPSQLSGGQKQRVGIARALANKPDVLLCDEATSALDPQTTLAILDLLIDIKEKFGITILMISHEVEVIKYACNHVAVIEHGSIKEKGSTLTVLQNPQSDTGKIFTKVEQQLKEEWILKGGVV
ncbi:methionine ABC transporter ATP-binding protein [Marinisporobacter balticus]|uniref:D-methionine transport system ATP-binding protein n=1 Tax=Marinisporobacter balticus TaxID=2018667 RepID=A0A4R2KB03_9FIRM|nr:methionine ABC transporter ATP-binding protein [Marinisporobacter balticus]TCO70651.1 D-methionine transport system ATP-binding protein [Marinisporobacter balticus]